MMNDKDWYNPTTKEHAVTSGDDEGYWIEYDNLDNEGPFDSNRSVTSYAILMGFEQIKEPS